VTERLARVREKGEKNGKRLQLDQQRKKKRKKKSRMFTSHTNKTSDRIQNKRVQKSLQEVFLSKIDVGSERQDGFALDG